MHRPSYYLSMHRPSYHLAPPFVRGGALRHQAALIAIAEQDLQPA